MNTTIHTIINITIKNNEAVVTMNVYCIVRSDSLAENKTHNMKHALKENFMDVFVYG